MIRYAKEEGKQLAVKEAFMKAYFEEGVDLTKTKICAVSVKAGLNLEKVSQLLDSDEGLASK
ncbi:MAG: DsbA family protein [Flammeovirgaceae bacterium]|nr:DsbA family protein [Flammeovirgaceae bacterium]